MEKFEIGRNIRLAATYINGELDKEALEGEIIDMEDGFLYVECNETGDVAEVFIEDLENEEYEIF